MIDSNSLSAQMEAIRDYGPVDAGVRAEKRPAGPARSAPSHPLPSPTFSVDNFVGNRAAMARQAAPAREFDRLMKNNAPKKRLKSMGCTYLLAMRGDVCVDARQIGHPHALWTSATWQWPATPCAIGV
ncbi:hypothetical protein [Acidovorax sp. SUPP2825]|uniref:hypothetical protein n=1 Tax=Acidovorax sp. SUPP2825 TaxID=2920879 RepID=UPI0023DE402A|nr:hypothetical protein [Acidovorax sp. SUPP2825]GKS96339.1 hypothetical protein AVAK2825_17410 [Acidovorax sp. SUPP2825]